MAELAGDTAGEVEVECRQVSAEDAIPNLAGSRD